MKSNKQNKPEQGVDLSREEAAVRISRLEQENRALRERIDLLLKPDEPTVESQSKPVELTTNDETLRLALEVAQLGFWDQDFTTGSIRRSPEWATMLGYNPEEIDTRIDIWKDLIHPDEIEKIERIARDHEAGKTRIFRAEHRLRTADGQWKWILNWGRVVEREVDGAPRRALGFHLDISDRKRAEEDLARADKLASIGTLAGGLAHDFNNVLTVIIGNLSLAQHSIDSKVQALDYLSKAEAAALKSQELTERLLVFARGGAPILERICLKQVISEAVSLALSGSPCRCETTLAPDLPLVEASSGQIAQVMHNLLLNAHQAMPDGGIIHIQARKRRLELHEVGDFTAGAYAEIQVRDEGPGIPAEDLNRIFDPFFTTKPSGIGLGLATVYSIVTQHRGRIEVQSEPGDGAIFTLMLPIGNEVTDRENPSPKQAGRRILVIEDDPNLAELVKVYLHKLGYSPCVQAHGSAGVAEYRLALREGQPFAAVLTDLTIPGAMGGLEAIQHILKLDPQVRAIVSSGYSNDPVMANYRAHGFQACLPKPYQLGDLARVLARVLNTPAGR